MFQTQHARVVGHIMCKGEEHLMKVLKEVEGFGGEGIMLRAAHSRYEHCRSKKLLKVKTFFDEEAKVIGHERGNGKNADKMGNLNCITPDGRTFDVGGGFTDKERMNPPKIGSIITYKYFELSAKMKPRFPIFVNVRDDIDWDEYCKSYKPPTKKAPPALKKTHTIMFSDVLTAGGLEPATVPGLEAGDDDDDDDKDDIEEYKAALTASTDPKEEEKSKAKLSENDKLVKRVPCKYGANCYRTNPTHLKLFSHPPDAKCVYKAVEKAEEADDDSKVKPSVSEEEFLKDEQLSPLAVYESQSDLLDFVVDDIDIDSDYEHDSADESGEPKAKKQKLDKRPICKYGDKCYRVNPEHFKQFRHIKSADSKPEAKAEDPVKYKAYLTNERDETFNLCEGPNEIGRGFAGITDQHLSRRQACIDVSTSTGEVTLTVIGGNNSFVRRAGSSGENWEKVSQGSKVQLKNKDVIMMVKDSPVFTLCVDKK